MVSADKVWEIIQSRANISGTWRHKWWFKTSFIDEWVFITIHENFWNYKVRIILFDKPQRRGRGDLHIFKISDCFTFDGAKRDAEEAKSELLNLDYPASYNLPILSFLKNDEVFDEDTFVTDLVKKTIRQGTSNYRSYISVNDADDYLRPFDILKVDRGYWFKHVAIYLGRGYICHFSGDKMGSSNSSGLKVEKDTLRSFFKGKSGDYVDVVRPIVKFKSKEKIINDIAKAITSGCGSYDTHKNNCEHFANMMVLGIKYSEQYLVGLDCFISSRMVDLKEEIKECDKFINNLTSPRKELVREIEELTREANSDSWGDWEARIEVSEPEWTNYWCKLQ